MLHSFNFSLPFPPFFSASPRVMWKVYSLFFCSPLTRVSEVECSFSFSLILNFYFRDSMRFIYLMSVHWSSNVHKKVCLDHLWKGRWKKRKKWEKRAKAIHLNLLALVLPLLQLNFVLYPQRRRLFFCYTFPPSSHELNWKVFFFTLKFHFLSALSPSHIFFWLWFIAQLKLFWLNLWCLIGARNFHFKQKTLLGLLFPLFSNRWEGKKWVERAQDFFSFKNFSIFVEREKKLSMIWSFFYLEIY